MNMNSQDIQSYMQEKRANAILNGDQEYRADGYSNMLNKAGTSQDNSTGYKYNKEPIADDYTLVSMYEGNGLFTNIIDKPAEEALKHGLDIDFGSEEISEYVEKRLDELNYEEQFATAEKWARLYGGAIIVMLVNDGGKLSEPLNMKKAKSIEELRVFERAIVQPDYSSMYNFHFQDSMDHHKPFGEPEYYHVFSMYGYFVVHRTRCLVFRNGKLPEHTTSDLYRHWGIPEYVKLKDALRECVTSHHDGTKLLERSVQAIYKMKNLANLLSTAAGEDNVLKRLQVIDLARGMLNTIAIDTDGEEYDFRNFSLAGVKDIIDSTCNMLSAVTNIPQTILFGRSPAGMNSTGENDMNNYYDMVEKIQKQNMKANTRTLLSLILQQGYIDGEIEEVPTFKMKFKSLKTTTDREQAELDKMKADTNKTQADTYQVYIENQVMDPSEVRKQLADSEDFDIEEEMPDSLKLPDDTFPEMDPDATKETKQAEEAKNAPEEDGANLTEDKGTIPTNDMLKKSGNTDNADSRLDGEDTKKGAAVLVVSNGKVLCGLRTNGEGLCGPGGHIEVGETPEDAAIREAKEEFGIIPQHLIPLGDYKPSSRLYCPSTIYLTDQFIGTPETDGEEMVNPEWLSLEELKEKELFEPFAYSIKLLEDMIKDTT